MKTRLALLSVIALATLTTSAHAQVIAADFSESLDSQSGSPWSSSSDLSLSTGMTGVNVSLSNAGIITLTDTFTGSNFSNLDINLTNIQLTPGDSIVGITPILAGAVTDPTSNSFLVPEVSYTSNSATLDFLTLNPSGQLALNSGGVSTYQLSIVPEPRDWAMIVLLGLSGLVVARKLRDRYLPGFSFAV